MCASAKILYKKANQRRRAIWNQSVISPSSNSCTPVSMFNPRDYTVVNGKDIASGVNNPVRTVN